jgi:hypothetical protein
MYIIILCSVLATAVLWAGYFAIKEREAVCIIPAVTLLIFTVMLSYVGMIKQHTYTVIDTISTTEAKNYEPELNYDDYYYVIANEQGVVYIVKATEDMHIGDQFTGSEAYLELHYEYNDSARLIQ